MILRNSSILTDLCKKYARMLVIMSTKYSEKVALVRKINFGYPGPLCTRVAHFLSVIWMLNIPKLI